MKNVIVTGANGFIGSSLIKKIIQKDIDASHEKIARDTNTTLLKPRYTKDEWESSIDMFGTSFDRFKPKLKMKYEELYDIKFLTNGSLRFISTERVNAMQ